MTELGWVFIRQSLFTRGVLHLCSYSGPAAQGIWASIYQENCFRPAGSDPNRPFLFTKEEVGALCTEQRAFFRLISGLQASISTHISAKYLDVHTGQFDVNLVCINQVILPQILGSWLLYCGLDGVYATVLVANYQWARSLLASEFALCILDRAASCGQGARRMVCLSFLHG